MMEHSTCDDDMQGGAAAAAGVICTAVQHEGAAPAASTLCQVHLWSLSSRVICVVCYVSLKSSAVCPYQGKHTTLSGAAA